MQAEAASADGYERACQNRTRRVIAQWAVGVSSRWAWTAVRAWVYECMKRVFEGETAGTRTSTVHQASGEHEAL